MSHWRVKHRLLGVLLWSVATAVAAETEPWQYGGTLDVSYANTFHGKATNVRWGMEIGGQAGYDSDGRLDEQFYRLLSDVLPINPGIKDAFAVSPANADQGGDG